MLAAAAAAAVAVSEATVTFSAAATAGTLQLQQQEEEQLQIFSSAGNGGIRMSVLASPTSSCSSTPATSNTNSPLTSISNCSVSSIAIDGTIGSKRVSANSMPLSPRRPRSQSPIAINVDHIDDDDADSDTVISKQSKVKDFHITFGTQHSSSSTMSQ